MAHESFHEALVECVRALGNSKVVAAKLWPAKAAADPSKAGAYLRDCLNPDRSEKLSLDELLLILREARSKGCHAGMQFLAHDLGYAEPQTVEPRDELSELLRLDLEANRETQRRQERIERLLQGMEKRPAVRAA